MTMLMESMTRVVLPKYTVRVWRSQAEDYEHETKGFSDIEVCAHTYQDESPRSLALKLMSLPNIAAVEVLDWNRNGLVAYSDWP
jgi:hypothetical protein